MLTAIDRALLSFDQALRTLSGEPHTTLRPNPAGNSAQADLAATERRHAARLMRVNHTGEVCAQALYHGQALTAKQTAVRDLLTQAAREEGDHLCWCQTRIDELGGRTSHLNPLFYAGSFALGALAGLAGDRWNLGFLAATERQVERHLERHLQRLPAQDHRSRIILATMRDDEAQHASNASAAGGRELPRPVQGLMALSSKLMTRSTYWI